jgi:NAD-dependent deacetylase
MENAGLQAGIERAADLLRQARHAIALTGAGVSTPSGIPDFRTEDVGLWEKDDPMEVSSIFAFRRNPEAFYRWIRPLVRTMLEAQPNPSHKALARLEQAGWLKAVLTQNIDGLHQKAGSRNVLELHGHTRQVTCISCFRTVPSEPAFAAVVRGEVPRCAFCGGVVKPDVVLFGEQLPAQVVAQAMEQVRQADLMLVCGSSLLVLPVARMPGLVYGGGGKVIIVNRQETYADEFAAVVLRGDVAEIMPRLAQACLEGEN